MDKIKKLKIEKICILGLFDRYNYILELKKEYFSILHAPNGRGKTTVLKLLNYAINLDLKNLFSIKFKKIIIEYNNNKKLKIFKNCKKDLCFKFLHEKRSICINQKNLNEDIDYIKDVYEDFEINSDNSFSLEIGRNEERRVDFYDFFTDYLDIPGFIDLKNPIDLLFRKFADYTINIGCEYIPTNRIFSGKIEFKVNEANELGNINKKSFSSIQNIKEELKKIINEKYIKFLEYSESINSNFPEILIKNINKFNPDDFLEINSDEQIKVSKHNKEIASILKSALEVYKSLGLIPHNYKIKKLDATHPIGNLICYYYYGQELKKLNILSEFINKSSLFKQIINREFDDKEISINRFEGILCKSNKDSSKSNNEIMLDDLSSGEQQLLIVLIYVIFLIDEKYNPDYGDFRNRDIILIDEPEISMHIKWQNNYLLNLEKIADIKNNYFILATHSPAIISEKWENTISLDHVDKFNNEE